MQTQEQAMAKALLGDELTEEMVDGQYYFLCAGYTFAETDEPVFTEPSILCPLGTDTGRKKWIVQTVIERGGSFWEPPDYDEVEVLKADSLLSAIVETAKAQAAAKIHDTAQAVSDEWYSKQDFEDW